MKICFFINSLNSSGGTERVSSVLANYFVKMGYCICFITNEPLISPFFYLDENIEIFELNKKSKNRYLNSFNNISNLRRKLIDLKVDILIDVCTALSLISIPALIGTRIKHIAWEHFHAQLNWNLITGRLSRFLVGRFCHKVVVLTERDRDYYQRYFKANNVITILNPVTISRKNIDLPKFDAKKKLDLDHNVNYIISVGRLTDQKGFDSLISIWSKVILEIGEHWKLLIIGSGENKKSLQDMISDLNLESKIEILPPTQDIDVYYRAADLYAMTSRFEGLPLVLIETKFFNLPSISFDCPNGPKEIVNSGIDGLLVDNQNIDEFSEKLVYLMKNPDTITEYSENCISVISRFELENIANRWVELFKEL